MVLRAAWALRHVAGLANCYCGGASVGVGVTHAALEKDEDEERDRKGEEEIER